jgi:hypothetical protein
MISLDMIAYNHNRDNLVELCYYTGAASAALQSEVNQAYADYSSLSSHLRSGISGSDHSPFSSNGFAGVLAIEELKSNGTPTNPYYHQSSDYYLNSSGEPQTYGGYDYIDFSYAEQMTRGAVGWMASEAEVVPEPATILLFGPAALWLCWRRRRAGV